jgi:hypothetical protein
VIFLEELPAGCTAGGCDYVRPHGLRTLTANGSFTPHIADKFELALRSCNSGRDILQESLSFKLQIRNPQPRQGATALRIITTSLVSRDHGQYLSFEDIHSAARLQHFGIRDRHHCLRSSAGAK